MIEALGGVYALRSRQGAVRERPVTIEVELPIEAEATVEVFSVEGERLATVHSGTLRAGRTQLEWRPGSLPAGVYLCRARSGGWIGSLTILLLR
jgi:hypothetical protein